MKPWIILTALDNLEDKIPILLKYYFLITNLAVLLDP